MSDLPSIIVPTEGIRPSALIELPQKMTMVEKLVDRGQVPDIATLERLIALENSQRERQAKEDFNIHFAAMQGDFKPVKRTKTARDNEKNRDLYDFAPVEEIILTNGWAIAKHGFSYTFREEVLAEKNMRRFYIAITGWGHTQETFVDLPDGGAKAPMMNGAQASRSLQSYGQRYALIAGFGFVMEDDDNDARSMTFEDGVQWAECIKLVRESSNLDELKTNIGIAWKSVGTDIKGKKILTMVSDKRKRELSGGAK